jgi:hypothetical protein
VLVNPHPSRPRHYIEPIEAKWVILYFQEKPLASDNGRPYPKPTQVVK